MALTDDDLPDDVLEEQAAAEGLSPRPTRRHRGIPHDADAEEAVIGAMLYSLDACDAAIEANTGTGNAHTSSRRRPIVAVGQVLDGE